MSFPISMEITRLLGRGIEISVVLDAFEKALDDEKAENIKREGSRILFTGYWHGKGRKWLMRYVDGGTVEWLNQKDGFSIRCRLEAKALAIQGMLWFMVSLVASIGLWKWFWIFGLLMIAGNYWVKRQILKVWFSKVLNKNIQKTLFAGNAPKR